MERIKLGQTASTNDWLRERRVAYPGRLTLVTADYQTAGRGATGGWHSAPGQNVVFSLMAHPTMVAAADMFVLSQTACVAVCRALNDIAPGFLVKWPNDIYHADRKVVGILIENELRGKAISDCVVGVGVNVNQTDFPADLPNPSSLALITGRRHDREEVLRGIAERFSELYALVEAGDYASVRRAYSALIYRQGQRHRYADEGGEFVATLDRVESDGHLVLQDGVGERRYAFKEVRFII